MRFRTDKLDYIELNTMAELQAFALGGTGVITLNFVERNELSGETYSHPKIIMENKK